MVKRVLGYFEYNEIVYSIYKDVVSFSTSKEKLPISFSRKVVRIKTAICRIKNLKFFLEYFIVINYTLVIFVLGNNSFSLWINKQ